MKKIFTAIALVITSFASAQIVNIPDPGFKTELLNYVPVIDINHDNEIQVSEASAVTELNLFQSYDLTGIQAFTNLEVLNVNNSLIALDLSNLFKLKHLSLHGSISPQLNSINLNDCHKLEYLGLFDIHAPNLDLRNCDSLATIKFGIIGSGNIGTLNISGLTKLDSVYDFGTIGSLIAINCTGLKVIDNRGNPMDLQYLLDVTGCTNLKRVYLSSIGYDLTSFDFSTCTSLEEFSIIYSTPHLQYLNLKNGRSQSLYLVNGGVMVNPIINVCADEFEIGSVTSSLSSTYGGISAPYIVNINSYCSFLPGGTYNTLKGKVKLDVDNNNCTTSNRTMSNVPIRITDTSGLSIIRLTDQLGDYVHYPFKGLFTITPYFPYPYFNIDPVAATVAFDTANSIISTNNFCIKPSGVHNDLEIVLVPYLPARPGFNCVYGLTFRNRGTTTLSGTVQLNYDNSKMTLNSSDPVINSQTGGQLSWDYSNLAPFEGRTIFINFNLLPPPVNNIGDTLIFMAQVNPVTNDETPYDNSFILPQLVRGSFDPNDKECLEGSEIDITKLNNDLHYLIRFQNLGNDTAFNIVVVDMLSNNVDWNTVEFIGSSHPCHVSQKNGRLEFFFENIQLPYKAINEPASNGYVAFKIKPKSSLILGDSLNNKAAIYFDFNPPVITNTAVSIVSPQRLLPVILEYFSANINGNDNMLGWKVRASNGFTNFIVERSDDNIHYTESGNITATVDRCQSPFNFIDGQPMPGKNYYRLRITGADGHSFYSDVKLIERTSTGFQATAVITDQNSTIVYLNSPKQQTIHMKIVASDGRLMYAQSKFIPAGRNQVTLFLKNIAKGIYTLVIYTNDGEIITKRFVK